MPNLLQNPPISIALPPVGIEAAAIANKAEAAVSSYTSGKVIEDYVSDNVINPLKQGILKLGLLYLGSLFVIVGLILLAINSNAGQKVVAVAGKSIK